MACCEADKTQTEAATHAKAKAEQYAQRQVDCKDIASQGSCCTMPVLTSLQYDMSGVFASLPRCLHIAKLDNELAMHEYGVVTKA